MPHEDLHGVPFYLTKLTSPRSDALRVIKYVGSLLTAPGLPEPFPQRVNPTHDIH